MDNFGLIWLVIGLPVAGFLIQALVGKRLIGNGSGKRLVGALAVAPIAAAFALAVVVTINLTTLAPGTREFVSAGWDWIKIAGLNVPFELRIDPLTMLMTLIITGIGALIHLYATGYMAEEKDYARFFTYLNLFIASMLMLVLGNNLVMLFIGWEGVGLCSYLLIGFWYKDLANAKAANKAFIVNRIGDWGLTLGMFLLFVVIAANADKFGAHEDRFLSYDVFLPVIGEILKEMPGVTTAIALLLFVGACGKSAQFPLYLWLPDAMAGPTPVSALIHAATMVTAGVFLLNRLYVIFELSPIASAVIACVGAFTALFAALVAFGQTDIKKVLAYSTVSQLGFMFVACGAGAYWVGMFHVTTHAFFKALLFLGSGAVIHAMAHNQDMRNYGKLRKYLPITFWTMMIGFVAIAGVPPFAGFFSKEGILGYALANSHATAGGVNFSYIVGWVGLAVALLTAFYMTRMTMLTFFSGDERWKLIPAHSEGHDAHEHHAHHASHEDHGPDRHGFFFTQEQLDAEPEVHEHHHDLDESHKPHEVPFSMWFPLVALAILSIGGGYLLNNNHLLEHWLYPPGTQVLSLEAHPHGIPLEALSIGAAVLGILLGLAFYLKKLPIKEGWDLAKWNPFRTLAGNQFGYDNAMVAATVDGGRDLGLAMWQGADAKVVDGAVNGSGWTAGKLGDFFGRIQNGFVRQYALVMLIGVVGLLGAIGYSISKGLDAPPENTRPVGNVPSQAAPSVSPAFGEGR
ncbi:MAG: NADH-quinone oxidoreductase subunit L [Chlorobia bacterium]|nr:NADH-quinone oxidoreductase subunit L [Fimbriimonadaceae bacterium]